MNNINHKRKENETDVPSFNSPISLKLVEMHVIFFNNLLNVSIKFENGNIMIVKTRNNGF
tara:strand:+ start:1224 stop:1403 length:180 start_codon:yes stop_codon:yes gene_type:complete